MVHVLPWVFSFTGVIISLYLLGIWRAYRAVSAKEWREMDYDVCAVYLFLAPIARTAIDLLLLADRLFYRPREWKER